MADHKAGPSKAATSVAAAALAGLAVVCCAGLPAIAAAIGGLTLAAVLGVGGGLLVASTAVAFGVLMFRARRPRSRPADHSPP